MSNEETLTRFLSEAGLSGGDMAGAAHRPEFLAAVMDFILTQDDWVLAASEAAGLSPANFVQSRAGLPGGAVPDWT